MKRAQVSIEYMMIVAFAFLFTIPLIAMFYSQSHEINEDIGSSQANRVASEMADAANQVYYLGMPSKKTILVYFPDNVKNVTFQGNLIVISVSSRAGYFDVVKQTAANLTGTVKPFPGLHRIEVEARFADVEIEDK